MGVLISTPLTAFIKAYYEEFYLSGISADNLKEEVDVILERKV
jgi:predicted PurR-regulated permease PerM